MNTVHLFAYTVEYSTFVLWNNENDILLFFLAFFFNNGYAKTKELYLGDARASREMRNTSQMRW